MFRLFQNIAFPLGMVEVAEVDTITEHDVNVSPYDYTLYTSIMCAESLKFYWTVYENSQIQCIDLSKLINEIRYCNMICILERTFSIRISEE